MPKTTEDEGGELGDRTRSYTNALTDTVPSPAIRKPGQESMPSSQLSFSAHPELGELDTDGDGGIDQDDLLRLLKLKHHEEDIIREQRYGLLFLSVVILGVGLGLGLELKSSKEATNDAIEDARLGGTQAHEVEVPSEMKVDWTTYRSEAVSTDPTEPPSVDLTDKQGNPIRSDRSLDKIKMTSELPDSTFAELERIQIEGIAGNINFKTQGFGRYTAPDSRCGSVVIVYTTMGSVQFDGTSMMFDEQVAGAFEKAGFEVSGVQRRARRTKSARSRRTAEMDESNYSLIGVNRMFGEFSFIANVDLSSLSCGDERPSAKTPFDGDVYDIQTEEHGLFACGEGATECPKTAKLIEGLKGETYFKRTTKMRAKKVDGVWRSIRATTFPDLNNDPAAPAQYRDGQFVEISNGDQGQTYQYWPNMILGHHDTGQKFTKCESNVSTTDHSQAIEANSTDIPETAYAMDFIGYDVLNNHYVKHFRVYDLNPDADLTDIDYLESYTEDRMYSVQLIAGHWTTYESIKTNGDVDPNFLQGVAYPDIDADDFGDAASDPVQCFDNVLWNTIDEFANYTYDDIFAFQHERENAAATPNLVKLLSKAWNFAVYEDNVQRQREIGDGMINTLFPKWNDDILSSESVSANGTDDGSGGEDDDGNDDERRTRSISDVDDTVADATGDGDNVLTPPNAKTVERSARETTETVETPPAQPAPPPPPQPALLARQRRGHKNSDGSYSERGLANRRPPPPPQLYVPPPNPYWNGARMVYTSRPRGTKARCAACRPGTWTLDRRPDGVMACFGFCSANNECGGPEYKSGGVDCGGGYEKGCDKCKPSPTWMEPGDPGGVALGYRLDGKMACVGKALDSKTFDGNGWCSAAGYCGTSEAYKEGGVYCGGGGQPPKTYVITKNGFQNKWCNYDKIPATPVSIMQGTADQCINACDNSPTCHWVGHRRSDGHCELWQVGSCKNMHYASGHDVYNIKVGQQSGGSKALVRTKDTSVMSRIGSTVMTIADISGSGAAVGGQFDIGGEMKSIKAINNNLITFDPPLKKDYPAGYAVNFAFGDNLSLELQLNFEKQKFPSEVCIQLAQEKIMGENPYLTFSARSCASAGKPTVLYGGTTNNDKGFFVELKLEMGGTASYLAGTVEIKGVGYIKGVIGVKNSIIGPVPYFLFEGSASIAITIPQVKVSLLVTATYEFAAKHRITLAGTITVAPGCGRRRRRRGFAAELQGVLLRDPRGFWSDAGSWVGKKIVDPIGHAIEQAGGAIASFAEDAVDFVKTLVCMNSISAALTFYYEATSIVLLKASFPRAPTRIGLAVCVKFLHWEKCIPFDLNSPFA